MGETAGQTEYPQVGFPGSFPNRKSLLGLLPALMFIWLGSASLRTTGWGEDYLSLCPVWLSFGIVLVAASLVGYRAVKVDEPSREASMLMLGWAVGDALLVIAFGFGSDLSHNTWLALALASITVPLAQLGVMFIMWDSMTGMLGGFAKAMVIAIGSGALVAAGYVAVLMSLGGSYAT